MLHIQPVSDDRYAVSDLEIEAFSTLRLWVFDLEATGLDTTGDRVTQIAGLPIEGGRILEDESFVQLVNPGDDVEISREVEELTGLTLEKLKHAPSFPEAWEGCKQAARGSVFWIGQSVFEFDVPLLEAELARHELPKTLPAILDSIVLATALLGEPEGRWSTSALIQRFQVDTSGLRRHDALDDVKILGRILVPMTEMIREDHGDRVFLPPGRPLSIKRHPPHKSLS
jgi:DNA polymerase III epsilon subunit-like protein